MNQLKTLVERTILRNSIELYTPLCSREKRGTFYSIRAAVAQSIETWLGVQMVASSRPI